MQSQQYRTGGRSSSPMMRQVGQEVSSPVIPILGIPANTPRSQSSYSATGTTPHSIPTPLSPCRSSGLLLSPHLHQPQSQQQSPAQVLHEPVPEPQRQPQKLLPPARPQPIPQQIPGSPHGGGPRQPKVLWGYAQHPDASEGSPLMAASGANISDGSPHPTPAGFGTFRSNGSGAGSPLAHLQRGLAAKVPPPSDTSLPSDAPRSISAGRRPPVMRPSTDGCIERSWQTKGQKSAPVLFEDASALDIAPLEVNTYSYVVFTLVMVWSSNVERQDRIDNSLEPLSPRQASWRSDSSKASLSLLHAIICCGSVVAMQLTVAWFMFAGMSPERHKMSDRFFQDHFEMSMEATSQMLRHSADVKYADSYLPAGVLHLCSEQLAVGPLFIYYLMLLLWVMTMLVELKSAFWLLLHIGGVELREEGCTDWPLLSHSEVQDCYIIDRLDAWMQAVIIVVVPGCRIAIALIIMYMGAYFLMLQTNPVIIVLQVLAIALIWKIDQLSMQSCMTFGMMKDLQSAKVKTTMGHPGANTMWDNGLGGILYMFIVMCSVVFLAQVRFGELMRFRESCAFYDEKVGIPGAREYEGNAWFPSFRF